jgi:1-acyl-sn-glycerol-3-phosphate acyltransferase
MLKIQSYLHITALYLKKNLKTQVNMKLLYWIPTVLFWIVFLVVLLIFHPLQILANWISKRAHAKVVDAMMYCINQILWIVGNRISYSVDFDKLSNDKPIILVANHQSMYDIPAIGWAFRKYHPNYIAKHSLGKGIPSISYNIRNGGSITIDQENPRSAIAAIESFGKSMEEIKGTACIFPEGARARDGVMADFRAMGLLKLLRAMPTAIVVPIALDEFWKFERWVCKPVPFGTHMKLHMLDPIDRSIDDKEIIILAQNRIREKLSQ